MEEFQFLLLKIRAINKYINEKRKLLLQKASHFYFLKNYSTQLR